MKLPIYFEKLLNNLAFRASMAIVAFIFLGNLVAAQSGITDQVSKIFYWEEKGTVAGEYMVKMALDNLETRGLIAMPRENGKVYLGWRFLISDNSSTGFRVYRSTSAGGPYTLINATLITTSTNYLDEITTVGNTYYYIVKPVNDGIEGNSSNEAPVTTQSTTRDYFSFSTSGYNKVSTGDLNGDGWFDFVILEPRIMKDDETIIANNKKLPAGQEYKLAAYTHNGALLWRFNTHLGQNEKDYEWAHSANFTIYDLNNDGRAEVMAIMKDDNDYKLAKLDGLTGAIIAKSAPFLNTWINESIGGVIEYFRIYVAVAYLDGMHPNIVMQAGRGRDSCGDSMDSHVIVFDNNSLSVLWDVTDQSGGDCQAGHGMEILDADGNGDDEILMGDSLIDGNLTNGNVSWSRNIGHPDVMVSGDIDPDSPGLEIFFGWEAPWRANGAKMELVRASDGQVLWAKDNKDHIHHGGIGNFTDNNGLEMFAYDVRNYHADESEILYLIAADGTELPGATKWGLERFPVHWSGNGYAQMIDPYDENPVRVKNYDKSTIRTFSQIVTQKWQEVAAVDIIGDWRDEIIGEAPDGTLYIFTNTSVINNREVTPLQDRHYRVNMTRFNQGYYRHLNTSGKTFATYALPNCPVQICEPNQSCSGNWIAAGNTNYCCDGTCDAVPVCGDGNVNQASEQCDDGDTVSGDGCSATCQTEGGGGGQTEIIKVDTGAKNPAVAVDSIGNLHFAYDCHTYVHPKGIGTHNACYRKVYSENGEIKMTVPQTLLTEGSVVLTADPRIGLDKDSNVHIIAGSRYTVITAAGQTVYKDLADIDNARLAVDKNSNNAFLLYRAGRYGGIMLKKISFDGTNINEIWTKTINPACPKPQMPGNVVIDNHDVGAVTWRQFGDHHPVCPGRNIQYAQFDIQSGAISGQREVFGTTSDFSDMVIGPDGRIHFIAVSARGVDGLWYKYIDNNTLSPSYKLLAPGNPGTNIILDASSRFGEANVIGPYMSFDKSEELYLSFVGAGNQYKYYKIEKTNFKGGVYYDFDVTQCTPGTVYPCESCTDTTYNDNGNLIPICSHGRVNGVPDYKNIGELDLSGSLSGTNACSLNINPSNSMQRDRIVCNGYQYYTAYYFILDETQLSSTSNNMPTLSKFTPNRTQESDQGSEDSNPIIGRAWNQGVFFAYEDNYENPLFDIYLKAAGGAVIGKPEIKADLNCDGKVDVQDFGILLSHWEKTEPPANLEHYANAGCAGTNTPEKNLDLNCGTKIVNNQVVRDIKIDGADLGSLLSCWGTPDPNVSSVCYGTLTCQ